MWELYFQFDGAKFVHKTLHRTDIRFLKLLSIMEEEGYGLCDSLYYVKNEGVGLSGLELVDSNYKVDEMLVKYASTKKLVLTVMKDNRKRAIVLSPLKRKHASTIDLDPEEEEPITHPFLSQDSSFCDDWQSQMDDHNFPQMHTQESVNCEKGKHVLDIETCMAEEEEEESKDEDDSWPVSYTHLTLPTNREV